LNGKFNNLEYGAAAPDAPKVFLNDSEFVRLWNGKERYYLVGTKTAVERASTLVGNTGVNIVASSGGKLLVTNIP